MSLTVDGHIQLTIKVVVAVLSHIVNQPCVVLSRFIQIHNIQHKRFVNREDSGHLPIRPRVIQQIVDGNMGSHFTMEQNLLGNKHQYVGTLALLVITHNAEL